MAKLVGRLHVASFFGCLFLVAAASFSSMALPSLSMLSKVPWV
jgi:hypothetical protein